MIHLWHIGSVCLSGNATVSLALSIMSNLSANAEGQFGTSGIFICLVQQEDRDIHSATDAIQSRAAPHQNRTQRLPAEPTGRPSPSANLTQEEAYAYQWLIFLLQEIHLFL